MKSYRTNVFNRFILTARRSSRGQSFVELMLVLVILALLLAGVVEFGFLMNNYLHVLDGAREAARYSSSAIAFDDSRSYIEEFYYYTAVEAATTMTPVRLDPLNGDDIVISVLSVSGTTVVRNPTANGWSLCANYTDFVNYLWAHDANHPTDPLQSVPAALADENWYTCASNPSHLSDATIQSRLIADAPNAGVLLVEVLYNYSQILKLPVFSHSEFMGVDFSLIPDPMPLYVYSIMPLSSAEPKVH
jgi:Tfp pilus assembly protein PilE